MKLNLAAAKEELDLINDDIIRVRDAQAKTSASIKLMEASSCRNDDLIESARNYLDKLFEEEDNLQKIADQITSEIEEQFGISV